MDTDLHYIIHSKQPLTDEHFKYFPYQLPRGIDDVVPPRAIRMSIKGKVSPKPQRRHSLQHCRIRARPPP